MGSELTFLQKLINFAEFTIFLLGKYWPLFLKGTEMTLLVALSGTVIGFGIGLLVAVIRNIPRNKSDHPLKRYPLAFIQGLLSAYVEIFRGTPMIIQAAVIYYGSAELLGIIIPIIFCAIFIVSINTGSYMAEIIRGGIISVDNGQFEGAYSIGMTHWQTMFFVVLPQAVRNIMPSIGNEFVINIKDSAVLSIISLGELFFQWRTIAGLHYRFFEPALIICVIYFILTFSVTRLLLLIEKKMDGGNTVTIHGSQSAVNSAIRVEKRDH